MNVYKFEYSLFTESIEGKNEKDAYRKMKILYPDRIPHTITLQKGVSKEFDQSEKRILGKRNI